MIDLQAELAKYVLKVEHLDDRIPRLAGDCAVVFNSALRTTGGIYYGRGYDHPTRGLLPCDLIEINPRETDEHQRNTLGHEFAHMLDARISGGAAHGITWRRWMAALGLPARECHRYGELLDTGKRYRVTCRDCGAVNDATYPVRYCMDGACQSPDVRVDFISIARAAQRRSK